MSLSHSGLMPWAIWISSLDTPAGTIGVTCSLGGAAHLEYSLVGDTANTAARLEALGKQFRGSRAGTILLGKPTARRLNGAFRSQPVGEIVLKGKSQKVEVYELLDEAAATTRADPRSDETSLAESRGTR